MLAATQIARAIFTRKGKVTVFVPHYAMSGGTLLALAADEIVMSDYAVLGPVDPQLGEYPAASILKAAHQKPVAEVDDKTLILADQAEKAIAQMRHEVGELLADRYPREKAEETAKLMTSGTWTHYYPITCERAQRARSASQQQHAGKRLAINGALSTAHAPAAFSGVCAGSVSLGSACYAEIMT